MKNILILGHTGYIGSSIYTKLKKNLKGVKIVGISSKKINLTNLSQSKKIKKLINKNTTLIICAAIKSDLGNSFGTYIKNIRIAENILSNIQDIHLNKIILFSSNAVYGVFKKNKLITEKTPLYPDTFYGLAKVVTEKLFELSLNQHNKNKLIILRPTSIYGPNEKITPNTPSGHLKKILNNEKISLWGNGEEKRDFLFIEDLENIVLKLINKKFTGILNLATGESVSYADSIKKISKLLNKKIIFYKKTRTTKLVDKVYSTRKIKKHFPKYNFQKLNKGLKKILKEIN
tara:strand:- start:4036 stop:4902 length:867 start_codon:yes stop_codon:yes gene_type:complete